MLRSTAAISWTGVHWLILHKCLCLSQKHPVRKGEEPLLISITWNLQRKLMWPQKQPRDQGNMTKSLWSGLKLHRSPDSNWLSTTKRARNLFWKKEGGNKSHFQNVFSNMAKGVLSSGRGNTAEAGLRTPTNNFLLPGVEEEGKRKRSC